MKAAWQDLLEDRLQLYGHRNWVVVADSAYPAQSSGGLETIVAGEEHTTVLAAVLAHLRKCRHIRPTIYLDRELSFVSDADAKGVASYRQRLDRLLQGHEVRVEPHEEIISRLDRVGQVFKVLLIKTELRIPYTSVFFELECGYWNAQAESRLREAMQSASRAPKSKNRRGSTPSSGR